LSLRIYPQRTQKTLKFAGLVASFIETPLPLRLEQSGSLNLFSAKDAKDAKDAKIYCYVLLTAADDNHYGKFSDQAG